MQRYYCFAKQLLIRKCSNERILPTETLQFVYCVAKGLNGAAGTFVEEIIGFRILELVDNDENG